MYDESSLKRSRKYKAPMAQVTEEDQDIIQQLTTPSTEKKGESNPWGLMQNPSPSTSNFGRQSLLPPEQSAVMRQADSLQNSPFGSDMENENNKENENEKENNLIDENETISSASVRSSDLSSTGNMPRLRISFFPEPNAMKNSVKSYNFKVRQQLSFSPGVEDGEVIREEYLIGKKTMLYESTVEQLFFRKLQGMKVFFAEEKSLLDQQPFECKSLSAAAVDDLTQTSTNSQQHLQPILNSILIEKSPRSGPTSSPRSEKVSQNFMRSSQRKITETFTKVVNQVMTFQQFEKSIEKEFLRRISKNKKLQLNTKLTQEDSEPSDTGSSADDEQPKDQFLLSFTDSQRKPIRAKSQLIDEQAKKNDDLELKQVESKGEDKHFFGQSMREEGESEEPRCVESVVLRRRSSKEVVTQRIQMVKDFIYVRLHEVHNFMERSKLNLDQDSITEQQLKVFGTCFGILTAFMSVVFLLAYIKALLH